MSDEAERESFTIKLGGRSFEIDPLNAGQVREIARAIDYSMARASSTEAALESYCMILRAALRIKHKEHSSPEGFDMLPATQGEMQTAARAVLSAGGFQVGADPNAPPADGEKKT